MLEQVAKKSLIISIILILLAAIISVSVLSINNVAFAEDEDPEEVVTLTPASGSTCTITSKNTFVSGSNQTSIFFGVRIVIAETAENVTIAGGLTNSKIVIEARKTDLNVTLRGSISGYDQEAVIYNESTKGTVHIINGASSAINITGKLTSTTGALKDGYDVYGVVASRGNISFEGGAFNIKSSIPVFKGTAFGNMDFGETGLQVFGAKDVYIKTTVNITGGDGVDGLAIGSLHTDGGHGGYAFDGMLARVHVESGAYLTLTGGKGGNGDNAPSGEVPGLKGYGGFAYNTSLLTTNWSRITTKNGANGSNGHNV